MFSRSTGRFLLVLAFSLLWFVPAAAQNSDANPVDKLAIATAGKLLPDKVGEFRASGSVTSPEAPDEATHRAAGTTSRAARTYAAKDGRRFSVVLTTVSSDSAAYAELTARRAATKGTEGVSHDAGVSTASFSYSDGKSNNLTFFKGRVSVLITETGGESRDTGQLLDLARALAATLDKGEGDIPVLVKHLPAWQAVLPTVRYALGVETLKELFGNKSVFDALSFEGGAEAAVANYDTQRLVLIEFNTPQLATENNGRIVGRIQELRNQGQPVPSAYRRVGNYAVFVFDSPSEVAANQLIDQVKYQQLVQWLGKNPFSYREAVAEFTQTTLGVLVSVVKASGIVLVGSLFVGGLFGALLFSRRRSQQRGMDAYSDAGGMLRLNIDDGEPNTDPARLLGPGN
ncbi:MAG TPA: DUF6599 family protein [Pyrinomonadaceae bacterium]|nr:DUF6599 family protein [Pyrinomonadaceae bacterium]